MAVGAKAQQKRAGVRNNIVTFIVARPSETYNIDTCLLYFFQATAAPPHCWLVQQHSVVHFFNRSLLVTTTINWPKSSSFSLKKG
jgi:hypothetical protein